MGDATTPAGSGRVAGSHVRYGPTGRAQRIKTGGAQWSDEAEELFLDMLAASCNVKMAAEAIGFHTQTAYRMRACGPILPRDGKQALEQGYFRLEFAIVEAACDSLADIDAGEGVCGAEGQCAINESPGAEASGLLMNSSISRKYS